MTIRFGDFIDGDAEAFGRKLAAPPAEQKPDHGRLAKWIDARFFGFIEPDAGGSIFIHGSVFRDAGIDLPEVGRRLAFTAADAADGRRRVARVWPEHRETAP